MNIYKRQRGFTMMEVLVVVSIISVLTAVILFSVSEARKNGRDKKRVSDVAQIEFALRLYVESVDNENIDCQHGVKISSASVDNPPSSSNCRDASAILSFIDAQLGSIPTDPKNDSNYYYYFDNNNKCNSPDGQPIEYKPMVFAKLEKGESNLLDVCPEFTGIDVDGDLTLTNSKPYVRILDFTYQ